MRIDDNEATREIIYLLSCIELNELIELLNNFVYLQARQSFFLKVTDRELFRNAHRVLAVKTTSTRNKCFMTTI